MTWLPDHMHEGWCEVPNELASRTFNLGGSTLREYPDYTPVNAPSGYVPAPLAPEVVATGEVLAGVTSPALDPVHTGGEVPAQGKIFGVIGAWDGHRVSKGRVVVDSTWHHFFDINLSGDRYLENNSLTGDENQKLHGFYVPDGSGGRSPNHAYRNIMWYYRNIIYWLIPADRHESVGWQALAQVAKQPQLHEELGDLRNIEAHEDLVFGHYLHFGQLAERYFDEARGHCASFVVKKFLYKPKIPWWEWVMDIVDIWDPLAQQRIKQVTPHEQWLGAAGMSMRPEIVHRLTLGAAVVTAAAIQHTIAKGTDSPRTRKVIQTAWTKILNHAVGEFGRQLRDSLDVLQRAEKLVDQTPANATKTTIEKRKAQTKRRGQSQAKSKVRPKAKATSIGETTRKI